MVNRSARHIHVQLINDLDGTTVAAASSIEADVRAVDGDKKAHSVRVGQLIAEGRGTMLTHWWLVTMPGIVLVVLCLAVNFVGDGLRDAFDSTARERPV